MSNSKWIPSWFYKGCSEHNIKMCQKCTDDAYQKRVKLQNTFWACKDHKQQGTLRCAICDEERIKELETQLDAVRKWAETHKDLIKYVAESHPIPPILEKDDE